MKGSIAIPLKMAGSAISTIVMSIEAMNVPSVVFERTTHLYSTIELLPRASCLLLSWFLDHEVVRVRHEILFKPVDFMRLKFSY